MGLKCYWARVTGTHSIPGTNDCTSCNAVETHGTERLAQAICVSTLYQETLPLPSVPGWLSLLEQPPWPHWLMETCPRKQHSGTSWIKFIPPLLTSPLVSVEPASEGHMSQTVTKDCSWQWGWQGMGGIFLLRSCWNRVLGWWYSPWVGYFTLF